MYPGILQVIELGIEFANLILHQEQWLSRAESETETEIYRLRTK